MAVTEMEAGEGHRGMRQQEHPPPRRKDQRHNCHEATGSLAEMESEAEEENKEGEDRNGEITIGAHVDVVRLATCP